MIDKIKDIIDEVKGTIEWILAGCPKPVKIPVESKERKRGKKRPKTE
jgi:hypothetical protein